MMINVNRTSVIMLEILMEVPVAKVIQVISVYLIVNVKVIFVKMVLVDIQMEKFGRMIQINGDGIKILIKNVRMDGKRNQSLIMVKAIVVVKVQKLDDLESDVVMMINVNQAYVIMLEIPREVPVVKVIQVIYVHLILNVRVVFVKMVPVDIRIKEFGRMINIKKHGIKILVIYVL